MFMILINMMKYFIFQVESKEPKERDMLNFNPTIVPRSEAERVAEDVEDGVNYYPKYLSHPLIGTNCFKSEVFFFCLLFLYLKNRHSTSWTFESETSLPCNRKMLPEHTLQISKHKVSNLYT